MTSDPRPVYAQLLDQRRADIALRERRHQWLAYARLAAVLVALAIVWMALAWNALSILWVLAPAAVFVALIVIHERLLKVMERRRRAQRYFERGMARLDGNWIGTGEPGDRYLVPEHPSRWTWISSARAPSSNCFAPPGRASARTRWPTGS